jgi:hypothetical protein
MPRGRIRFGSGLQRRAGNGGVVHRVEMRCDDQRSAGKADSISTTMAASMTRGPIPSHVAPQACTTTTSGFSSAITGRTSSHKILSPAQ